MFNYKWGSILLFLVCLTSTDLQAQIKLNNLSVGSSVWFRTYNTPDERVALVNPPAENGELNPMLFTSIIAEIALGEKYNLVSRVGYGTNDYSTIFTVGNLIRTESIAQVLIPLSLGINYNFISSENNNADNYSKKAHFFAGAGFNRLLIQHSISRVLSSGPGGFNDRYFVGNDFGVYIHSGISKPLSKSFDLILDARYNAGYYIHRVYPDELNGQYLRKRISANGIEAGLRLVFNFNNK
ncbi:hypothetical protein MM213_01000 [Belliella sp. R4-6]|uniref:Outer membrane protein beta-barrel domain-containing protein n=1 Tax=Belliella alkalica TaxID=1730871 RepID=A0ABS9V750_9BACT|nr:hypothetical protein [Belliella alkalica]MCH7412044.1 hypothetical protein [Belliella alkalica]